MANVLVLNAGSGSQKVALYSIDPDAKCPSDPVWQAAINSTTPGQPEDKFLAQIKSTRGEAKSAYFPGLGHRQKRSRPWFKRRGRAGLRCWRIAAGRLGRPSCSDMAGSEFSRAALVTPDVESDR